MTMQKGTIKPLQPTGLTLKHKLLSDSLKRFPKYDDDDGDFCSDYGYDDDVGVFYVSFHCQPWLPHPHGG